MSIRGAPLLPEDLQLADQVGELTSFVDIGDIIRLVLVTVLAVGLGFLLDYLTKNRLSCFSTEFSFRDFCKKPRTKKQKVAKQKSIRSRAIYAVATRILIIPLAIWGLIAVSSPIIHHSGQPTYDIGWLDATFVAWNPSYTYDNNGFILGFLYNLGKFSLDKPEEYSESKIAETKKSYESKTSSGAKTLQDADYNIVVILNESFYDISLLWDDYPYTGADNLPVFHELMKKYPSGYMYSPEYGGGTANVEFEVDTGLSNYWANTVPYTDILPKIDKITSIANEAKTAGYRTTAIHSYVGSMYKRNFSLQREGFDTFITQSEMHHTEHDGNSDLINDRSIYEEAMDVIKSSGEKQLISLITMQNHTPYHRSNYDEYAFDFSTTDLSPDYQDILLAYMQSAYNSDAYLGEFLDNLSKLDEHTVVLFYGDHAPGIFTYNLIGTQKLVNLTHLTPYFIWYNFDPKDNFSDKKYGKELLEKFDGAFDDHQNANNAIKKLATNVSLPTTTPNCLTNTLYGVLNLKRNAEKNLLNEICESVPILAASYLGGTMPTGKVITDYQLLNYDVLSGKQYWFKD